jgi:hypothetical protein
MSWWREERIGNKKNIVLGSFNIWVFLALLAIGIVGIGLALAARIFAQ